MDSTVFVTVPALAEPTILPVRRSRNAQPKRLAPLALIVAGSAGAASVGSGGGGGAVVGLATSGAGCVAPGVVGSGGRQVAKLAGGLAAANTAVTTNPTLTTAARLASRATRVRITGRSSLPARGVVASCWLAKLRRNFALFGSQASPNASEIRDQRYLRGTITYNAARVPSGRGCALIRPLGRVRG